METTGVAGTVASTASTTKDRGVTSLSSEDFFKLLVVELQQQDPLKPAETSDMLGQVADIRSIELSKQLTDVLGQVAQQQRTSGAGDFLGKYVVASVTDDSGNVYDIRGVVTAVRFDSSGNAALELDTGATVLANDVTHITTPETAEALAATADSGAGTEMDKNATDTNKTATQKAAPAAPAKQYGPLGWLGSLVGL